MEIVHLSPDETSLFPRRKTTYCTRLESNQLCHFTSCLEMGVNRLSQQCNNVLVYQTITVINPNFVHILDLFIHFWHISGPKWLIVHTCVIFLLGFQVVNNLNTNLFKFSKLCILICGILQHT